MNVILSQLMCYKYSSETLQKSLSRDSQSGSRTEIGIKIFLLTKLGLNFSDRDRDETGKGWSRYNAFTKGIYQSDNITVPKQKQI